MDNLFNQLNAYKAQLNKDKAQLSKENYMLRNRVRNKSNKSNKSKKSRKKQMVVEIFIKTKKKQKIRN